MVPTKISGKKGTLKTKERDQEQVIRSELLRHLDAEIGINKGVVMSLFNYTKQIIEDVSCSKYSAMKRRERKAEDSEYADDGKNVGKPFVKDTKPTT